MHFPVAPDSNLIAFKMPTPPAIHWFRRDLRLTDNTALNAAAAEGNGVIPVYILSSWKGSHAWTGPGRQAFLCSCLQSLDSNLRSKGGRLIVREGSADSVLAQLILESGARSLHFNRDPDPFGRAMEDRVTGVAQKLGVQVHAHKDHALHERDEVLTAAGQPFRVFTPFSRAWQKLAKQRPGKTLRGLHVPETIKGLPLPTPAHWGLPENEPPLAAGEAAARKRLDTFLSGPVLAYGEKRDLPGEHGTSRISQDLRQGLLSIREVYERCAQLALDVDAVKRRSVAVYINELIWREFYFQVLWHWPQVLEHEFLEKFRSLRWRDPGTAFQRWCQGETGFPIVDAGMRELQTTGFMHNRVRMITAMFLVKDLHISWKEGERWFMQHLLDGEIASNNGGWQWSAGTGTDAAPYFRIQNPWTQTSRFDPEGSYIQRWIPELRGISPTRLFQPPAPGICLAKGYPAPMVDHAEERDITLEIYRA